jgi:hypothetical protein
MKDLKSIFNEKTAATLAQANRIMYITKKQRPIVKKP